MKLEVRSEKLEVASGFAEAGFEILESVLAEEKCNALAQELTAFYQREQKSRHNKIGGVRNLLRTSSLVAEFASSPKLQSILESRVVKTVFPVRALFFDKTTDANWRVPWHQDLTIAVAEKIEMPEFVAWTVKNGVLHVQPPQEILESMVAIRLHLDDCNASNGALKIITGSHLSGKLGATEIAELVETRVPVVCEASKGSVLLMRPLLLHSSSPAKEPLHRRVLHIEYATTELPNGLKWFDRL